MATITEVVPGTLSESHPLVTGTWVLELSSAVFPSAQAGSWIGNGVARAWTGALMWEGSVSSAIPQHQSQSALVCQLVLG